MRVKEEMAEENMKQINEKKNNNPAFVTHRSTSSVALLVSFMIQQNLNHLLLTKQYTDDSAFDES